MKQNLDIALSRVKGSADDLVIDYFHNMETQSSLNESLISSGARYVCHIDCSGFLKG